MIDQLIGFILLGLGLQSPIQTQQVLGVQANKQLAIMAQDSSGNGGGNSGSGKDDSTDSDDSSESEDSGSSGATGVTSTATENEEHTNPTGTPYMIDGIPSNVSAERRAMYKKEIERRKSELETKKKAMEAQFKQKREALKTSLSDSKDIYRTQKRNPDEFRLRTEEEKAAFIDSMKAKIEQSSAQREEKLTALKAKMSTFKDQAKKTKVEDLQTRITSFVTKRISTMTLQITKMTDIVALNKTQVTEKASGKDSTAFNAASSAALTAINTAKDKLSELSSKQYVVIVTSESTVKNDVETVRKTIDADMKSAQELMKNARVAVSKMITERAKLLGEPIPDAVIK